MIRQQSQPRADRRHLALCLAQLWRTPLTACGPVEAAAGSLRSMRSEDHAESPMAWWISRASRSGPWVSRTCHAHAPRRGGHARTATRQAPGPGSVRAKFALLAHGLDALLVRLELGPQRRHLLPAAPRARTRPRHGLGGGGGRSPTARRGEAPIPSIPRPPQLGTSAHACPRCAPC
jgi:hypothetical protein